MKIIVRISILLVVTVTATKQLPAQWVQTNGPFGGFIQCFAVSPNNAGGMNIFVGTRGGGIFFSTNSGARWVSVNSGLTNLDVVSLAVANSNIFAGTRGGGVFLSTNDGTNWNAINSGLTKLDVRL